VAALRDQPLATLRAPRRRPRLLGLDLGRAGGPAEISQHRRPERLHLLVDGVLDLGERGRRVLPPPRPQRRLGRTHPLLPRARAVPVLAPIHPIPSARGPCSAVGRTPTLPGLPKFCRAPHPGTLVAITDTEA